MNPRPKRLTRSTGVTLEIPVLDYLRGVAEKENRDRSFCINLIVREHAERNGQRLALAKPPPALNTTKPNEEER
jgi:hypothetical protein